MCFVHRHNNRKRDVCAIIYCIDIPYGYTAMLYRMYLYCMCPIPLYVYMSTVDYCTRTSVRPSFPSRPIPSGPCQARRPSVRPCISFCGTAGVCCRLNQSPEARPAPGAIASTPARATPDISTCYACSHSGCSGIWHFFGSSSAMAALCPARRGHPGTYA